MKKTKKTKIAENRQILMLLRHGEDEREGEDGAVRVGWFGFLLWMADVGRRWCERPTTRWSKMVADYSLTADDYSLTVEDGEWLDRNLVKQ